MNWTKEIPTVDGWYWVRYGEHTCVELIEDGCTWSKDFREEYGYEFYGPLEEPK